MSKCPGANCTAVDAPFTETGLTGNVPPPDVPEPSAILLSSSALAAGMLARRKAGRR
jgi:hypothetical protein